MGSEFPVITNIIVSLIPIIIPVIIIVLLAIMKSEIMNIVKGIAFRKNSDFQEGDPVFLEGRKARIVKIGMLKTKIYMLDKKGITTVRIFRNSDMEKLKLEKILKDFNGENK